VHLYPLACGPISSEPSFRSTHSDFVLIYFFLVLNLASSRRFSSTACELHDDARPGGLASAVAPPAGAISRCCHPHPSRHLHPPSSSPPPRLSTAEAPSPWRCSPLGLLLPAGLLLRELPLIAPPHSLRQWCRRQPAALESGVVVAGPPFPLTESRGCGLASPVSYASRASVSNGARPLPLPFFNSPVSCAMPPSPFPPLLPLWFGAKNSCAHNPHAAPLRLVKTGAYMA
jgi:hypothetical protein